MKNLAPVALAVAASLTLAAPVVGAAPIVLSPTLFQVHNVWPGVAQYFTFDDSAFPDVLVAHTLETNDVKGTSSFLAAINDHRLNRYLDPDYEEDWFTLSWNGGLWNNAGFDLALFELWEPEPVRVLNPLTSRYADYMPRYTGYRFVFPNGSSARVNLALVDLSDFGLSDGQFLTTLTFGAIGSARTNINNLNMSPEIAVIGALGGALAPPPSPLTISEPSMAGLLGLGLVGLVGMRRLNKRPA